MKQQTHKNNAQESEKSKLKSKKITQTNIAGWLTIGALSVLQTLYKSYVPHHISLYHNTLRKFKGQLTHQIWDILMK
jgi:hypothetical protein